MVVIVGKDQALNTTNLQEMKGGMRGVYLGDYDGPENQAGLRDRNGKWDLLSKRWIDEA
jgi:hypothetical protein